MKITKELSLKLYNDYVYQLKRIGIVIGYYYFNDHVGSHLTGHEDFIVVITCDINLVGDVVNEQFYIIERPADKDDEPFLIFNQKYTLNLEDIDLNQRSERLDDFLIDVHQWEKSGKLIHYKYIQCRGSDGEMYEWRPTGDGRLVIHRLNTKPDYMYFFEQITDPIIKESILQYHKSMVK